ncbi:MAG: hypothetical protein WCP28_21760, partial [Actinomycetes bacterium]
ERQNRRSHPHRYHYLRRSGAVSALGVAMVAGTAIAVAAPAQAEARDNGQMAISAPNAVWSGQWFTIKCKAAAHNHIGGWTAKVQEKGLPFNAYRTVNKKGDCTMRVVAIARGKHKFRVVAVDPSGLSALTTDWIWIKVR